MISSTPSPKACVPRAFLSREQQDLLGHRSGRITTHKSAAELQNLLEAANRVCDGGPAKLPRS